MLNLQFSSVEMVEARMAAGGKIIVDPSRLGMTYHRGALRRA